MKNGDEDEESMKKLKDTCDRVNGLALVRTTFSISLNTLSIFLFKIRNFYINRDHFVK